MLVHAIDDVVLRIEGDDARSWLQGQITADIGGGRSRDESVYALVLDTRGKVLSDLWVQDLGDVLELRVPAAVVDAVVERLERYLVMEDAEIVRTEWQVVHVDGGTVPENALHTPRLSQNGYDKLVANAGEYAKSMGGDDGEQAFETARIQAGVPRHGVDFGLDTLPQEAGLWHAISFEKGCYLGQEPVVMLEHRGKPPRRLVHLALEAPAEVGAKVLQGERAVGEVTSSAGVHAIARVKRKALEAEDGITIAGHAPRELRLIGG